jgi:hypothetical protein
VAGWSPLVCAGVLAGLLGLFLMTMTGGLIGYRQASAGRYVRSEGVDRFLQ